MVKFSCRRGLGIAKSKGIPALPAAAFCSKIKNGACGVLDVGYLGSDLRGESGISDLFPTNQLIVNLQQTARELAGLLRFRY